VAGYNDDAATVRLFFDGHGQASNALDSRYSMRSQPHMTSLEVRLPASFSDALRRAGICRPKRRTVEFPGWDEIMKPPPIGHFVRFLLRAIFSFYECLFQLPKAIIEEPPYFMGPRRTCL
jgi:hypothetical protein